MICQQNYHLQSCQYRKWENCWYIIYTYQIAINNGRWDEIVIYIYTHPLVNWHSYGTSPRLMAKSTRNHDEHPHVCCLNYHVPMVFPGNQRMNPWPGIASSPAPHPSKAVHVEPAAPWTPCEARAAVVKLRKVQNHGVSQVSIYLYSVCVYVYMYINIYIWDLYTYVLLILNVYIPIVL